MCVCVCVCVAGALYFFNHQRILQRAVWTSLEMQLDQRDPIATQGWPIQEFLRKPPGEGSYGIQTLCSPMGSTLKEPINL